MSSTDNDIDMDDPNNNTPAAVEHNDNGNYTVAAAHGSATPHDQPMDVQHDDNDPDWVDDEEDDNADPEMPPLEPADLPAPPSAGRRRGRVSDDGDQDRDRRHPTERTDADWQGAAARRVLAGMLPSQAQDTAHHPHPPTPLVANPLNPGPGVPPAAGGAGNPQPAFGNPFAEMLHRMMLGGLGSAPPEKDDPTKAKMIVDALEDVPVGLVRRLERASPEGNGCAICWDKLLDAEGEGFGMADDTATAPIADSAAPTGSESGPSQPASTSTTASTTEPRTPRIVTLPCTHVFHASCLIPWFSRPRQTTCPTCRFNLDPDGLVWGTGRRRGGVFPAMGGGAPGDAEGEPFPGGGFLFGGAPIIVAGGVGDGQDLLRGPLVDMIGGPGSRSPFRMVRRPDGTYTFEATGTVPLGGDARQPQPRGAPEAGNATDGADARNDRDAANGPNNANDANPTDGANPTQAGGANAAQGGPSNTLNDIVAGMMNALFGPRGGQQAGSAGQQAGAAGQQGSGQRQTADAHTDGAPADDDPPLENTGAPPPPSNANAAQQPHAGSAPQGNAGAAPQPSNAPQFPLPPTFAIPFGNGTISIGFDMFLNTMGGGEDMAEDDMGDMHAHGEPHVHGEPHAHGDDPDAHDDDAHQLPFTPMMPDLEAQGYHYHPTPDGRGVTLVGPGGEDTGMDFFMEDPIEVIGGVVGGMPGTGEGQGAGQSQAAGQQPNAHHTDAQHGNAQPHPVATPHQDPHPQPHPVAQPTTVGGEQQAGGAAHFVDVLTNAPIGDLEALRDGLQDSLRTGLQAAIERALAQAPMEALREALGDDALGTALRGMMDRMGEGGAQGAPAQQPPAQQAAPPSQPPQQQPQTAPQPQLAQGATPAQGAPRAQPGALPFPFRLPGMEGLAIPIAGVGLGTPISGVGLGGLGRPPWMAGGLFATPAAGGNGTPAAPPPPSSTAAPPPPSTAPPPTATAPPPAPHTGHAPQPGEIHIPFSETFTTTATARFVIPPGGGPPQMVFEGMTPPVRAGGPPTAPANASGPGAGVAPPPTAAGAAPHAGAGAAARAPPAPRPRRNWTLPSTLGSTLREVVEKREREAGLRCSDHSCGVGPSDEDPDVEVAETAKRQVGIVKSVAPDGNASSACSHVFHPPCLVSAQRVALRGAEESIVDGRVDVTCPVCRVEGTVGLSDWEEGVRALE